MSSRSQIHSLSSLAKIWSRESEVLRACVHSPPNVPSHNKGHILCQFKDTVSASQSI